MFGPPPACLAQPQIESSICSASILARLKASFATARHERGMHQFEMDEMRQHLTTIADNNHSFRESWQREVKRITKTIRNILRK